MVHIFAPGCALTIYKPYLADKLHNLLNENIGNMERLEQQVYAAATASWKICP